MIEQAKKTRKKQGLRGSTWGGLSHEEIGKRLGISGAMVFYHEKRALKKMREAAAAEWLCRR